MRIEEDVNETIGTDASWRSQTKSQSELHHVDIIQGHKTHTLVSTHTWAEPAYTLHIIRVTLANTMGDSRCAATLRVMASHGGPGGAVCAK